MDYGKEEDRSSAPFNMALFTLEKIHNILKLIAYTSAGLTNEEARGKDFLYPGRAQHTKYRLVRQLFIQSIPLINHKKNPKYKEYMGKRIKKIKLTVGNLINSQKQIVGITPGYSQSVDDELDNIMIEIQQKLQEEGYFMPPKSDPRFGWKFE